MDSFPYSQARIKEHTLLLIVQVVVFHHVKQLPLMSILPVTNPADQFINSMRQPWVIALQYILKDPACAPSARVRSRQCHVDGFDDVLRIGL